MPTFHADVALALATIRASSIVEQPTATSAATTTTTTTTTFIWNKMIRKTNSNCLTALIWPCVLHWLTNAPPKIRFNRDFTEPFDGSSVGPMNSYGVSRFAASRAAHLTLCPLKVCRLLDKERKCLGGDFLLAAEKRKINLSVELKLLACLLLWRTNASLDGC